MKRCNPAHRAHACVGRNRHSAEFALRIGPLRLRLLCPDPSWEKFLCKYYGPFLSSTASRAYPRITISRGTIPCRKALRVSASDGNYCIERSDFKSVSTADFATTALSIDKDRYSFNSWLRVFCTLYGLSNAGLLLHSAGICHRAGAYVFAGRSGSGKSTMTRLLGKKAALSDELVLLTRQGNRFSAHSTPFWGELKHGSGRTFSARANGIYFLRHGSQLKCIRLSPGEALKRLLPTVLFFSRDPLLLDRLLGEATQLAGLLPAFEISFSLSTKRAEILNCISEGSVLNAV